MRRAGILMPITALPSPYGIGTLGSCARQFAEFLQEAGQSCWQILPICPTGYGDSPYQSSSSFAGNPYLIDLDDLAAEGLLLPEEYRGLPWEPNPGRVSYESLYRLRFDVLRKAVERIPALCGGEMEGFLAEHAFWLEDYALFMALKARYGGGSWQNWPAALKRRESAAIEAARKELGAEMALWRGIQFLFFRQWKRLKAYVNERGISVIGDIPIYVAADSADVWTAPEQFQLDAELRPTELAGCPPDSFSEVGQLWGNPLFDWDFMRQDGYAWWQRRISFQLGIYDILRIDHFRGFDSYYAIPAGDRDARRGRWRPGPGIQLFETIEENTGKQPIIAEDLGFLTPSVLRLLEESGFPGMKVLQFAFDSRDTGMGYLPHCYPRNCVAYVGTHDNDTAIGWMESAPAADVARAKAYLRLSADEGYHWGMMRSVWASVADLAIIQLQDLLGLGSEGRFNTPATLSDRNWTWRCPAGAYGRELAARLRYETALYERLG